MKLIPEGLRGGANDAPHRKVRVHAKLISTAKRTIKAEAKYGVLYQVGDFASNSISHIYRIAGNTKMSEVDDSRQEKPGVVSRKRLGGEPEDFYHPG